MKKRILSLCLLLTLSLLSTACYKEEIPYQPTAPEHLITTSDIQHFGWNTFVSNEGYAVSSERFDPLLYGTAKYNLTTGTLTPACLLPDCTHHDNTIPSLEGEPCHIPKGSRLHFIQDTKVFLTYSIGELLEHPTELGNVQTVQIFAYYDLATGEHEDLLTVHCSEHEQMYNTFLAHDYCIYYTRYVPKCDSPTSAQDYAMSLCRMKMGEYQEEVLADLSVACGTEGNRLMIPFAVDRDRVYLYTMDTGRILSMRLNGSDLGYLLDGSDGVAVNVGNSSIFYHNGYIYFLSCVKALDPAGAEADPNVNHLYRLDCETGERRLLTTDYVTWLFVCDQSIYYEMNTDHQPTEEQLAEALSAKPNLQLKRIEHDGSDPVTLKIEAPNTVIDCTAEVWGGGAYLFFPLWELDPQTGGRVNSYTLLYHVSTEAVIIFGRDEAPG